jgi:pimeloyl-ACP methyl ester carboxylesterase
MRLNFLTAIRAGATRRPPVSVKPTIRAIAWLAALAALLLPAARGEDLPWCPPPALDELWPCDEATLELPESAPCAAETGADDACSPAAPCRQRDVWSVITRGLPDIGRMPTHAHPGVERLDARGCWQKTDLGGLLENPRQPLLVFIHGNRYDHASAREQGLLLAARTSATCADATDVRTVIFSWPSDKQGILLRDSRAKYERAVTEGHYLAWLLSQVEPDRPVAIVGYSYGSLVALEALEDLVHAECAGRSDVQTWTDRTAPLHVVLVAGAVRQDAFAPRGPYRETLPCIDRLTVLYNSSDIALRFFEYVDRSLRTEALGHVGMSAAWVPSGVGFSQVDSAGIVGPSHRFKNYLASSALMRRICTGAGRGLCCGPNAGACPAPEEAHADSALVDGASSACPCGH